VHRTLTLISAPAGSGKTTLVSQWIGGSGRPTAWLSLDAEDRDVSRFLMHLVAALQTVAPRAGRGVLAALLTPQPPATEALLTALTNDIAATPDALTIVLDDYHLVDAASADGVLTFLVEHLPQHAHLVVTTRMDPALPLARLRARGLLTEIRALDLRFDHAETGAFLGGSMGLTLTAADVSLLEDRTEGWIAGLQLAAISMSGRSDASGFIRSFTGTQRHVMDFLVEEVLDRQPARLKTFLLQTSMLSRLCGPLCDAVLQDATASGQRTLEHLERSNLFLVPLDEERRWYRYHHLFADLLRQRLHESLGTSAREQVVSGLNIRASIWHESNGLEAEAFEYAAAANDIDRAARLMRGGGIPLHVRGAAAPVLRWLESLPSLELDARPALWVAYATVLAVTGRFTRLESTLRSAEAALRAAPDAGPRGLDASVASLRNMAGLMAADPEAVETVIEGSRRVGEDEHLKGVVVTAASKWRLGLAYQIKGGRAAATRAYSEAISTSEAEGSVHVQTLATTGLGNILESQNQPHRALESYRRVLGLVGEPSLPIACEAHLGIARVHYAWNDLEAARLHGMKSLELARQLEISSFVSTELFLARLKLALGDVTGAAAQLADTERSVRRHGFLVRLPDVASARVAVLLHRGEVAAAARTAWDHDLPLCRARVHLARGDGPAARDVLIHRLHEAEEGAWEDERLGATVLLALAHREHGDHDMAHHVVAGALAQAEPQGLIRVFVDEGRPMARLLAEARDRGVASSYIATLLTAFDHGIARHGGDAGALAAHEPGEPLEPLSSRELEVLRLIADGYSNEAIGGRLFRALSTIKGHNKRIFEKLQVRSRTEAVARARAIGIL
jgi:LuxR family transcriptional regulator, maltose regulon positive regulatory protein